MFCSKCGAQINESAKFCSSCGASLERRKKTTFPDDSEKSEGSAAFSSPFVSLTADDRAYKISAVLVGICTVLLLLNWISFPILGSVSSLLGTSSEYTIPGLTLDLLNINSLMIESGASRDVLAMVQGPLVLMVFLLLAWLCAIGFSIVSFVTTLKKRSIIETYLLGSFGWNIGLAVLVVLATLILNTALINSNGKYLSTATTALNLAYISPTLWVWITGIVAGTGLYYVVTSQKKVAARISSDNGKEKERDIKDLKESIPKPQDTMYCCPKCNHPILKDDLFCTNCGTDLADLELEKQVTCIKCGESIDRNALYCEHCGEMQKNCSEGQYGDHNGAANCEVSDITNGERLQRKTDKGQEDSAERAAICKNCGAELKQGWKFCGSCGSAQE